MQTKQTPQTSALETQLLAEFEAFKAANDARLSAIEAKTADVLLDEKVSRIDASLSETKSALDRLTMSAAAPFIGDEAEPAPKGWSAYLRSGDERGVSRLDMKSLNQGDESEGGYVAPPQLDRLIEARLLSASPMRQIATVRQTSAGTFKKPVSLGASAAWAACAPLCDVAFRAASQCGVPSARGFVNSVEISELLLNCRPKSP